MWIARDRDGKLYLYEYKPIKDLELDMWGVEYGSGYYKLTEPESWMFKNVKWEDKEPTELILKK